jgi:chromosome segregation ATPase
MGGNAMPYKDMNKQREAVNKAVKKCVAGHKLGRPIGSSTYDTPEMVALAIAKQEKRMTMLSERKTSSHTKMKALKEQYRDLKKRLVEYEALDDEEAINGSYHTLDKLQHDIGEADREYRNATNYINECRGRIKKLVAQMQSLDQSTPKKPCI